MVNGIRMIRDCEMNVIITDVVSLTGEVQGGENCETRKESESIKPLYNLDDNVNATKTSRIYVVSQMSLTPALSKQATSLPANEASITSKDIGDTSVSKPIQTYGEIGDTSVLKSAEPAVDGRPFVEPIPNIEKCLIGWKEIYPWVQYNESKNTITCSVCQWGYSAPNYYEVYTLLNSNNLLCVATMLRSHCRVSHHIDVVKDQELILKLCEAVYPFLKHEILATSNFCGVKKQLLALLDKDISENTCIVPLILQNLALGIESFHLESLIQSPFFSVIAFGKMDSIIIRWLTQDYEVVEHVFCSQIQSGKDKLPIMSYLQYQGVDMTRMVSYSDLLNPTKDIINSAVKIVNVADRCCPIERCIGWLRHANALVDLFMHLQALPELCRVASTNLKWHYKFRQIANITKSEASNLILDEGAMDFLFNNSALLDTFLKRVSSDLENGNKLNFSGLKTKRSAALFHVLSTLKYALKDDTPSDSLTNLEEVKRISTTLKMQKTEDPEEYFVMSIVDMFISHAILSKTLQKNCDVHFVDILLKRMSSVSCHEMEWVFRTFMNRLCDGKGFYQLHQLHAIFGEDNTSSPLTLLANLQSHPEYHLQFPELLKLGQIIMVLPVLNAHTERYTFDVAVAKAYLEQKVEEHLVSHFLYILLEGPDKLESLSKENILKVWHRTDLINYTYKMQNSK